MKHILKFYNYIKENEDKIENPKRVSTVVFKKFFKELKEHVIWWFKNDILNKYYILDSVEIEKRSCVVWFCDKSDGIYQYKLKYLETEPMNDLEKMENCLMILKIYIKDTQELIKETEERIPIKYLNADYLQKLIEKLKRRIVTNPKNDDEREDFITKQSRHLSDNIY